MANNNEKGQVPAVPQLPLVNVTTIHPHAVERYEQFLKELYDEVPINKLEDKNFNP